MEFKLLIRCSEEKPKPAINSEGGFTVTNLHEVILEGEYGPKNKCGARTDPWTLQHLEAQTKGLSNRGDGRGKSGVKYVFLQDP